MSKLNTIMIQICDECLTGASIPPMTSHRFISDLGNSQDLFRPQCMQQGCFYFLQKPPDFYIAPEMYDPAILRTESPLGRLFEVMD